MNKHFFTLLVATTVAAGLQAQTISTFAGNGTAGYTMDGIAATASEINLPTCVATDAAGNLYIADPGNNRVRMVNTSGIISTVAGTGTAGYMGDGAAATAAQLNEPFDITLDAAGNLYIADRTNHRIRKVSTAGIITTIAGTGTAGYTADNVPATGSELYAPSGVAVDATGNVYIADLNNHRVRKVNTSGTITTVAGIGVPAFSGDHGQATAAAINGPGDVTVDGSGNIYISDVFNQRVRKVNGSTGIITTITGNGTAGDIGDGNPATAAEINGPGSVDLDASGNIYISETGGHRIRMISTSGTMSTYAGTGLGAYGGDGGPATLASLNRPRGVAFSGSSIVYIGDFLNSRVRRVKTHTASVSTVESDGVSFYPNPTQGELTIIAATWQSYTVIDIMGRAQLCGTLTGSRTQVNTASLAPGTYYLRLEKSNGSIAAKLLKI